MRQILPGLIMLLCTLCMPSSMDVHDSPDSIRIDSPQLSAEIRKKGYVSGVAAGSFLDRQTGFRDPGFGLDIVDWILEPGSDTAYRDRLPKEMVYDFHNAVHGDIPKRIVEGPQICTQAGELAPEVIRGPDFVAVKQRWRFREAMPGREAGSEWEQTLLFPEGKRYFLSSDRVTSVNAVAAPSLRLDMPGHIKHTGGDTFGEVYLSYAGRIPAKEFLADFPPDARYLYRRGGKPPKRFIRAYHLRDPKTGTPGPWLAGMTLRPSDVSEAWCHHRGYVCFIEEIGGHPVKQGESFGAAFLVGYFDSIAEMNRTYDQYAGASALEVDSRGWRLVR